MSRVQKIKEDDIDKIIVMLKGNIVIEIGGIEDAKLESDLLEIDDKKVSCKRTTSEVMEREGISSKSSMQFEFSKQEINQGYIVYYMNGHLPDAVRNGKEECAVCLNEEIIKKILSTMQ